MGSSRIVVIGLTAALVLAACGDSTDSDADTSLQPATPIRVSGAGAATPEATAEGRLGSDAAMSSMPAFAGYTFGAAADLPALPANSTGYHFPAGASVDAARVAELAAALGVEGEPVAGGGVDVDGLSWRVGPDDGTAPMLTVGADAQLSVNYSSAWADATSTVCVEPVDVGAAEPDAGTSDTAKPDSEVGVEVICEEPAPPANVPTADAAEVLASELLDAIGADPSSFEFETYADEWAASVTAWSRLDGVRSPVTWGFGFGEDGALQWMYGTLATPIATGPYRLIDIDEALVRLEEQNMWFGGGGVAMEDLAAATVRDAVSESPADAGAVTPTETPTETPAGTPTETPTEPSTSPEVPADTSSVETLPVDTLPVETEPVDTVPVETLPVDTVPVETISVDTMPVESVPTDLPTEVVTLVDVRADLWWAYDDDGSVWLLPAYTFTDGQEREFTVPSVTDEFLIITEPVLVDPMPLDPVLVDPVPVPDEAPEPDVGYIVGLGVDDATARLAESGLTLRVVIDDGTSLAVTEDFSSSRVNVEAADDVVIGIVSIG
jgi:hypothetical protein